MSHYLYLILGTIFLFAAVVVAIARPDLRRGIIYVALAGAAWGPVSELWFYRDYWHPEYVLGSPLIEDIIYGAGISAAAAFAFKFIARLTDVKLSPPRTHYRELGGMVLLYIAAMIVLQMILHINSILVAIGIYIVFAIYILIRRPDLWIASVTSAMIMGLTALGGYAIGLDFLVPEPVTLARIWLLFDKPLGVTVLGHVPLTEVAWYTAWGLLLGILYEYITGSGFRSRARSRSIAPVPSRPDGLPEISSSGPGGRTRNVPAAHDGVAAATTRLR